MAVLTEKAELHRRENKIKHRNQSRETSQKRPRPRSAEGNLSVEKNSNLTTQLRLKLLEEKQLREGFSLLVKRVWIS